MRSVSRPVLLALAGCSLAVATAAPASAKSCPSGQILQVSKGKCISKTAAKKAGIAVHTPGKAAHSAAKAKSTKPEQSKREKAGESTVAKTAREKTAPDKSAPEKAAADNGPAETTIAAVGLGANGGFGFAPPQSEAPSVRRNIAPFGALQFSGFR